MIGTGLRFVSAALAGLAAGFFFAYEFSVDLGLATAPAATYVDAMQRINESVRNAPFGVVFFGALAAPVLAAAAGAPRWRSPAFALLIAGIALYAAAVALTFLVNIPINEAMSRWNAAAPPADWADQRARWFWGNGWRTAAAIAAFVCMLAALAWWPKRRAVR